MLYPVGFSSEYSFVMKHLRRSAQGDRQDAAARTARSLTEPLGCARP